jgi:uncharacterized membrane protein YqjE
MATEREPNRAEAPTGWRERLAAGWEALSSLIATRLEIFQQELAEKTGFLARGVAGLVVGIVFGWLAVLLFTALVATLLALLFGHVWAGILGAFVLYLVVAGVAVMLGVKAFSRVRPFHFPATSEELRKDFSALRRSTSPTDRTMPPAYAPPAMTVPIENLEERFRAGSAEGGE